MTATKAESKKKNRIRIDFTAHPLIRNQDVWLIEFYDGDDIVRTQFHSEPEASFGNQVFEFKHALDQTLRVYAKTKHESTKENTNI